MYVALLILVPQKEKFCDNTHLSFREGIVVSLMSKSCTTGRDVFFKPLTSRVRVYVEEQAEQLKSQITPRKQHFPDTILMYIINSESVTAHIRPTHIQARQNSSMGERKQAQSPTLYKKLFAFIPVRKKNISCLFQESEIRYINHIAGQDPCSETAG